jgi:protein TonB
MIAKKNPGLDLEKKRGVLLQVGLLTVGSLTLAAFTYRSPSQIQMEKELVAHVPVTYEIQEMEKPKPIKVEQPKVQRTNQQQNNNMQQQSSSQANPSQNIQTTQNKSVDPDPSIGLDEIGGDCIGCERTVVSEIVDIPDIDATFIGGVPAMKEHINNEVVYPEISITYGDQGTVYVSFVVETDGSITNISVERGVTEELDREAKRVVRSFPKWKPGEVDAEPVRTRVRLPISFILDGQ